MRFDLDDGTVTLPNGVCIGPACDRRALRDDARLAAPPRVRTGAPPWRTYEFDCGEHADRPWTAAATFDGDRLDRLTLRAELLPAEVRDRSEAAAEDLRQHLNERMLADLLGEPTRTEPSADAHHRVLGTKVWGRPWGVVRSCRDPRGAGSFVEVRYSGAQRPA